MADFEIIRQPTTVWEFDNPTLLANQIGVCSDIRNGVETDTGLAKLGNGVDDWDTLGYFSPSDSAVWGEITGTLSDQTDLQDELDAKLPTADILRSYLASTVTYNNVDVLANTALSVTVAAGGIYDVNLTVQSTNAGQPLKLDFAGTATIANFIGEWSALNAADPFAGSSARITAAGTDFNGDVGALGGADGIYKFTGSVEITAGGTFLLRGAQVSADPTDTTIIRGSTFTLTKMN